MSGLRERLSDFYGDDLLFLEESAYDEAILGVAVQCGGFRAVCYDRVRLARILVAQGMTDEDAEEWLDFNVTGAYVGPTTPVFIDTRDLD